MKAKYPDRCSLKFCGFGPALEKLPIEKHQNSNEEK
jgi:hypothetical protein